MTGAKDRERIIGAIVDRARQLRVVGIAEGWGTIPTFFMVSGLLRGAALVAIEHEDPGIHEWVLGCAAAHLEWGRAVGAVAG